MTDIEPTAVVATEAGRWVELVPVEVFGGDCDCHERRELGVMGLAEREAGPEPYRLDYGPAGDKPSLVLYEADWYLWRAIHRDTLLTEAEWNVRIDAYAWALDRLPRSNVASQMRRWTG